MLSQTMIARISRVHWHVKVAPKSQRWVKIDRIGSDCCHPCRIPTSLHKASRGAKLLTNDATDNGAVDSSEAPAPSSLSPSDNNQYDILSLLTWDPQLKARVVQSLCTADHTKTKCTLCTQELKPETTAVHYNPPLMVRMASSSSSISMPSTASGCLHTPISSLFDTKRPSSRLCRIQHTQVTPSHPSSHNASSASPQTSYASPSPPDSVPHCPHVPARQLQPVSRPSNSRT